MTARPDIRRHIYIVTESEYSVEALYVGLVLGQTL